MNKAVGFKKIGIYIVSVILCCVGCKSDKEVPLPDTIRKGVIHISVDESFKPVIDAQIHVYEAAYPETKIIAHYKPEAECLRDLANDSIRMIICTRWYSKSEDKFLRDSMRIVPSASIVANDAIAVVVHPQAADSMFTLAEIKGLLQGTNTKGLEPVLDGVRATSTVRYMLDSVLRQGTFGPTVVAAKSSVEVLDYVAKTPKAVGFIGVSWIGNKEDTAQTSFLKKVKIAFVESTNKPGGYVLPLQYNIYSKAYPMVRDLVYILKENHHGLGHGFAAFLAGERGQLIFKRSYLQPSKYGFILRSAILKE
ncbi:MAG TPA: substrate-binding domain-containing protein [Chitinophagaceae bacterium]|nr:substrate-binding domain-containing protein [Chitinophagaceae bacterium]